MTMSLLRRVLALAVSLLACAPLLAAELPRVLGPSVSPTSSAPSGIGRAAVRSRAVAPNFAAIEALASDKLENDRNGRFVVDLFPGLEITAHVTSAERRASGTTLFATLENVEAGTAVLTVENGYLNGSIDFVGGSYVITADSGGGARVVEVSARLFPNEAEPLMAPPPSRQAMQNAELGNDVPVDSGRLIDVAVFWTSAAASACGGCSTAQMQALAQSSVDLSNAAYYNSGIAERLRLVYSGATTYTEQSSCTAGNDAFTCALDAITNNQIPNVFTLRTQYGADLVSLLISDNAFCGLAWLPNTITSANAPYGFSVVEQSCAVGNKSFPHELGHNMGAQHDTGTNPSGGAFAYSHGYIAPNNAWRTVMAYPSPCSGCARLPYFSSPNVSYTDGQVMGDASLRNNALTLNKSAKAIAGYRATATPPGPQTPFFTDVLSGANYYGHVQFMAQAQYTSGCATGLYCPGSTISRRQMAVFLERIKRAANYVPPAATGIFLDVPSGSQFAAFIERLYYDGITTGCGAGLFCPDADVSRAAMAKFILKGKCGGSYTPGPGAATSPFTDVPTSDPFYPWIYKLYSLGITGGCAAGKYCPVNSVTRAEMAIFLERAYAFGYPSDLCSP